MTTNDPHPVRPNDEHSAATETAASDLAGSSALPEALTVDEVASLLRVDRKSVYAAVSRGEIPGVLRVGRLIRFSREAVLRWVREGQAASRTRRTR